MQLRFDKKIIGKSGRGFKRTSSVKLVK